MKTATPATTVALMVVRVTGAVQIVTGLLFWTGNALALLPVHLLSGVGLVLALWALAVLAARAGVGGGRAALAGLWGALVVGLGLTQSQLLPGDAHWVVQVLHLLVGLVAMGLAQDLATRTRRGGGGPRAAAAAAATAALALVILVAHAPVSAAVFALVQSAPDGSSGEPSSGLTAPPGSAAPGSGPGPDVSENGAYTPR
jgi:hypothetical protein